MFLTAKTFRLKEENISPNHRERPLIRKTGWGATEREERQRDRKERKRGEDAVLYEKGG